MHQRQRLLIRPEMHQSGKLPLSCEQHQTANMLLERIDNHRTRLSKWSIPSVNINLADRLRIADYRPALQRLDRNAREFAETVICG